MRRILAVVVVLMVIIGVVGFSRGWFQLTSQQQPGSQIDVNLRVDPQLIQRDVDELKHEVQDAMNKPDDPVTTGAPKRAGRLTAPSGSSDFGELLTVLLQRFQRRLRSFSGDSAVSAESHNLRLLQFFQIVSQRRFALAPRPA